MSLARKFISGVGGLYTTLNPITLSGVNDVIVVKDESGTMRCSPFQVRFSKLRFHNMKTQIVHLYVNGKLTDIRMSITSQGDVFFAYNQSNQEQKQENILPTEVTIEHILENKVIFPKPVDLKDKKPDGNMIVYNRRVYTTYSNNLQSLKNPIRDDQLLILRQNERYNLLDDAQNLVWTDPVDRIRLENLGLRIFAMHYLPGLRDKTYESLAAKYSKIGTMLSSVDHYAALLEKVNLLVSVLDALIHKKSKAALLFSLCLNNKIEGTVEETFTNYLVSEVESPESTVVRLEMPLGCSSSAIGCICSLRKYRAPHKVVRFYLPFILFSRLFFEARSSKDILNKTVDFLEREYNNALGWNIFGKKQFLKRDIGFSLKLCSKDLESLELKPGKNDVVFKIGGVKRQLEGSIFLWRSTDKIVISDIDGTITKSDIRGHLYGFVGKDWTHTGVAGLFSRIVRNGYKILYLTARPLGQSSATRSYLQAVSQDSFSLPDGPVILSPGGVFEAFYREVIAKKPEVFKIECLMNILDLFDGKNPFVAGFGNRISDVFTYKALSISSNRIYTINHSGQLVAEYTQSLVGTYHTMNEFVDSIFPSLHKSEHSQMDHSYSEFGWWKSH